MVKNLYHKQVYWKRWFDTAICKLIDVNQPLKISSHFNREHTNNKMHGNHLVDTDKLIQIVYKRIKSYLFEVETEYENHIETITKAVFRAPYDDEKDVVIVVRNNLIVTAWFNHNDDKHMTLDASKYVRNVDKKYHAVNY